MIPAFSCGTNPKFKLELGKNAPTCRAELDMQPGQAPITASAANRFDAISLPVIFF